MKLKMGGMESWFNGRSQWQKYARYVEGAQTKSAEPLSPLSNTQSDPWVWTRGNIAGFGLHPPKIFLDFSVLCA